MRGAGTLIVITVLVLVASAAGLGAPAPPTLRVKATEFAFQPKELTARAGEILFVVENEGVLEHNFVVEDSAKKRLSGIAIIPPGHSEQLRVTLRAAAYTLLCDLPGHREAGMEATLRVNP